MLTENQLIDLVCSFLTVNGYEIIQKLTTKQTGVDIVALTPNKKQCYIEAKGATSSKPESSRFGKEFDKSQIKTHIGIALVKTFQLMQSNPNAEVFIALPNNKGHKEVINSMYTAILKSGVHLLFVSSDDTVKKYI